MCTILYIYILTSRPSWAEKLEQNFSTFIISVLVGVTIVRDEHVDSASVYTGILSSGTDTIVDREFLIIIAIL